MTLEQALAELVKALREEIAAATSKPADTRPEQLSVADAATVRARIRLGVPPDGVGGSEPDVDALRLIIEELRVENSRLRRKLESFRRIDEAPVAPLRLRTRAAWTSPERPGMVYAIALIPELTPYRIKVGYTEAGVGDRLRAFATTCPTAQLLGVWAGNPADEERVLNALPYRIGESEVFVCNDAEALLAEIDHVLGAGTP
jgi:hypothetical protein